MKKVVLIGATGFVGSHILEELVLRRKYKITAVARHTEELKTKYPDVIFMDINVRDIEKLSRIISGNDLVISAFNAGWTNPDIYNDYMEGAKAIEKAVEFSGVNRLIVVGGAGSLYIDGKQLVDGSDFPDKIKPGATAARDYLNEIKHNKLLDWVYFSPAINMSKEVKTGRTGKYRIGTDNPVFDKEGKSVISVEDAAVAVVDEAEKHNFSQQRFTAGY